MAFRLESSLLRLGRVLFPNKLKRASCPPSPEALYPKTLHQKPRILLYPCSNFLGFTINPRGDPQPTVLRPEP